MKKLCSLVLVVIMIAMLLGGCGANEGSKDTITILYPGDESERMSEFLGNEFAQKMEDDLGLKVKMIYLPWDQYWEQKDVMLAAKEPIDLYWDGLPDLATFVNKKQVSVLNDLIDKYGQDMLKVLPKEQLTGATMKGKIYGIPSAYAPSSGMFQMVCVRQDILEAVGMTEIKTAEDLRTFAEKVKEQFPEMKGPADPIFKPLTRYFSDEHLSWVAIGDTAVYGENTNKVYDYYETDAFKKIAEFNRKMYNDGLYGDELTIKYNERDSRMQTGLYLWVEGSLGKDIEIINTVKANAPEARLKSYILKPEEPRYIIATGGEVLCIPQTAPNPEGAMKFINWIYKSQDNYLMALYGVKDKDYKIVDGRIEKITPDDFFYEWMFRNKNYQLFAPDIDQAYIDEYEKWDDNAIPTKALGFRFNNENVKDIEIAITEVTGKEMAPILYGFSDYETEYPKALQKLKDAGIDQYIAEVQKQMDEFLAEKK
jgi:putative aldouronate transport system substrate-binding protein